MVGTSEDELLYQQQALRVAGIRLPWLLINLVGLVVTGLLLERFQVTFKEALFLLTFVPVIMGMGGNSGSQTSTITVRGLATGRIGGSSGGIGQFLWNQAKVGALLGLVTGLLAGVLALLFQSNLFYALVVGGALFLAILLASVNGAVIPLLFQRFGIDPAVAAGPLVTTSNDITGILIYFGLAALLIDLIVR
jgi:magnesium transporter